MKYPILLSLVFLFAMTGQSDEPKGQAKEARTGAVCTIRAQLVNISHRFVLLLTPGPGRDALQLDEVDLGFSHSSEYIEKRMVGLFESATRLRDNAVCGRVEVV